MTNKSVRLGRGLDTLIAGGVAPAAPKGVTSSADPLPTPEGFREIDIALVEPSPHQPRREIDDALVVELAESIRQEGLLQPIVVRQSGAKFQIVAGERRWRACKKLNHKTISARVVHVGESSAAAIALIENLQRENLNPIEEALGYASLMRDFDLTQEAVAERVAKPRSTIANSMRLLQLGKEIQGYISKGLISVGHAKVLLGLDDDEKRALMARRVVEKGLSVRDTEKLVESLKKGATAKARKTVAVDASIKDIEKRIQTRLGAKIQIRHGKKHGRILIDYYGESDFERIVGRLCGNGGK
jgi:ParB family transcriptional regulator, chromosome partitioning protein